MFSNYKLFNHKLTVSYYTSEPPKSIVKPTILCSRLNFLGIFCIVLFVTSILVNSAILNLILRDRSLKKTQYAFILALVSLNLFGTLFELPWIIISNFYCKWVFGPIGCTLSAFIMYTVGCTSIMMMCAISFERYYMIHNPMNLSKIKTKYCWVTVGICLLIGLFWASCPLFGWSSYVLEGASTSCAIDWSSRTFSVMSYNVTIFFTVFIGPLAFIIVINGRLILLLRSLRISSKLILTDNMIKKKLTLEKQLTVSSIVLVFCFIVTWLPYAVVSMYTAFIDDSFLQQNQILGTIPAIFAKSSMVWPSVFYVMTNKNIKKRLLRQNEGTSQVSEKKSIITANDVSRRAKNNVAN